MLTLTQRVQTYTTLSNDDSDENKELGKMLMYTKEAEIISLSPWFFLEKTFFYSSQEDVGDYPIGVGIQRVVDVTVLIDDFKCSPAKISSWEDWQRVSSTTSTSSTYPQYYFVHENTISFWPNLATTDTDNIIVSAIVSARLDEQEDYSTGTVSVNNGATAVTGSGTSWTVNMVGSYILLNELWYPIVGYTSSTSITIGRPFEGDNITGSTYTIGVASVLPAGYELIPVYFALVNYYGGIHENTGKANIYSKLYDDGMKNLRAAHALRTGNVGIDSHDNWPLNPNLSPRY